MSLRPSRRVVIAAMTLWVGAAIGGTVYGAVHDAGAGVLGDAPRHWPLATTLAAPHEGRPTVLVFAHPRCPCTRATVAEAARLAARIDGNADITFVLYRPSGAAPAWADGDVRDRARAIPGVTTVDDEGGRTARLFDAVTSGTTLVYDGTGALRFRGGITPGRGHEGDAAGSDAVLRIVKSAAAHAPAKDDSDSAPVFGCPIAGSSTTTPPERPR